MLEKKTKLNKSQDISKCKYTHSLIPPVKKDTSEYERPFRLFVCLFFAIYLYI